MIKITKQLQKEKNEETLLGIDFGDTKIGLAFGRNGLAMPLKIVSSKNKDVALKEICQIAVQNHITKIVIGLPTTYEGKETLQSKKVREFTKVLKHFLKLPSEFMDEYGTSGEALGYLMSTGTSKNRREMDDSVAAALILKRYYHEKEDK